MAKTSAPRFFLLRRMLNTRYGRPIKRVAKNSLAWLKNTGSVLKLLVAILRSPSQRKHTVEWLKSLRPGYLLNRPMPWIVFDAYEYLKATLPQNIRVFEYGSGASTLYWLREKNATCVSIEHDAGWYRLLTEKLQALDLSRQIDYRWVAPELRQNVSSQYDDPETYTDDKTPGYSFESYVKQIDEFPPDYFDVVMVDGRCRPACIVHGLAHLKVGGMLVVDNADRGWYFNRTGMLLEKLALVSFTGVAPAVLRDTVTNIYVKTAPEAGVVL